MSTPMTSEKRRQLAEKYSLSEQYLYQLLTGRRDMSPIEARRLEEATGGELTRRMLCQKTWHRIWPELVTPEHPAPSATDQQPAKSSA